ncbi:MAG: CPBP family intramembrane metalloprotease [Ruminococcaceae bacterium]|nr:CPBP family intramembrane metalloprotease [Oscillospiraceae bacterium]
MKKKVPSEPVLRTPEGIPGLPKKREPSYHGVAGTLLLVHTLLAFSMALLGVYWLPLQQLFARSDFRATALAVVIMQGLLIFLPAVITLWTGKIPPQDVIGRQAAPGSLFLALAAGIPAAVVFQGINNLLVYLMISSGIKLPQPDTIALPVLTDLFSRPWPFILLVLLIAAVIPAVIEEFFFRGVLLASLQSSGATRSAVIWQAVAFALFHADAYFLLSPFLAGLLLARMRRHCGRLWPAIITHLTMNISSIALTPLLPKLTGAILQDHSRQATSLLYASLIAASIAAVALIPIIVLLGSRPVRAQATQTDPSRRLIFFPGDWKFALALDVQVVTLFLIIRL